MGLLTSLAAGGAGGPIGLGIGAGVSLLGGLLGRSGPSKEEKEVLRNQAEAQRMGMGVAKNLIPSGIDASMRAGDYWTRILSGDRSSVTAAAAPDILRIGDAYEAAAKSSAALNPRGGPSAEFLAEQPFQKQRDVSMLLGGLRGDAANKAGAAGSTMLSNAIQAIYGSSSAGQSILASAENRKAREAARGKQIGAALYDILRGNEESGPGMVQNIMDWMLKNKGATDYHGRAQRE